ncbi:conjugative transfer protein MobI(A/C) [Luteimonas sp. MHLX1A]|uniref:conjugative transfer protein MobI(A/C) n=1 Tax=Alterluteimonas muca TaxID=2878684 RepID=UPI001E2D26AB|nr:conjugative transfer protein MobI(A/C) [Luteimonas sp. MHLX1A]MCD9046846.1 hypothetical protein [Luteimonas sp. MHLX1A]
MFDVAPSQLQEVDLFEEAAIVVQSIREQALSKAQQLAKEYSDKRTELQLSAGDSFIALALVVRARNDNRSIQILWQNQHYRGRKLVGGSDVSGKKRGESGYDLSKLTSPAPAWSKELVKEYELKAREIREALLRLTEVDDALKVVTRRLKKLEQPPELDDGAL